jgi:metal-responsive CopG/Arc/MetJ family transcriptional regulator
MPGTTTKVSISLPTELLAAADQLLAREGEGRSATIARVLQAAVRAARDAEIDAEYERAFPNGPSEAEQAAVRARSNAAYRSVHGPRR